MLPNSLFILSINIFTRFIRAPIIIIQNQNPIDLLQYFYSTLFSKIFLCKEDIKIYPIYWNIDYILTYIITITKIHGYTLILNFFLILTQSKDFLDDIIQKSQKLIYIFWNFCLHSIQFTSFNCLQFIIQDILSTQSLILYCCFIYTLNFIIDLNIYFYNTFYFIGNLHLIFIYINFSPIKKFFEYLLQYSISFNQHLNFAIQLFIWFESLYLKYLNFEDQNQQELKHVILKRVINIHMLIFKHKDLHKFNQQIISEFQVIHKKQKKWLTQEIYLILIQNILIVNQKLKTTQSLWI
ncbi:unnamed protein product [Paramecium sonneborni]|uniref:Transmembrane protein n=1 Tax=Paramecium sonneborni TaxID=65129 RepID=A0A8S1NNF7_9CILI|nr:unnamed protein product [Paramecium sonneborni]